MIHAPLFALPFGEGGPKGRVRCGTQLLLSVRFGETVLRTNLIRPCRFALGHLPQRGRLFYASQNFFKISRPTLPLFSGWNWQPKMLPCSTAAVTEYGIPITAAVEKGNIFGCQFHPEKSGNVGLSILKTFCEV